MDVFIFNGEIKRIGDLRFIEFVDKQKKSDELLLILTTPGGSPDAAYKIGRYLQSRYSDFKILIPGWCKSAGTLLAISANELVFSPYGELGPLDVQMTRPDKLAGLESGLNITDAFFTLENRAKETFNDLVNQIIEGSNGIVSFPTASHSASEIVGSLYGPIFARIDPEEVGSRARAMRIGEDYGKRLNERFKNLKPNAIIGLSQDYPSHGFVIDRTEASILFERVREANVTEKALIARLGVACRFTNPSDALRIENLTELYKSVASEVEQSKESGHDLSTTAQPEARTTKTKARPRSRARANGKDSTAAV